MAHMLIYRYEDEKGRGPGIVTRDIMEAWNDLPTPFQDGIGGFSDSHHCGCKCRKTLGEWFDTWMRREVKRRGLSLAVYQVPDHLVKVGKFQVVFDPKDATSVRKKNRSGISTSTDQAQASV